MKGDKTNEEKVKGVFQKTLNEHGYGFHYSVLDLVTKLYDRDSSRWLPEAAEVPVRVQGSGTRIDFILRRHEEPPFYLLAECKRANPALSNWCFARAPFVRRNFSHEFLLLEQVIRLGSNSLRASVKKDIAIKEYAYHIALEVKSDKAGDSSGKVRGAIEEAATQVCRGLNGMIEFLSENIQIFGDAKIIYLLPAIFTTAQIWASEVNLGLADINSGNVDLSNAGFSRRSWIAYQYHLSPGLKHSHSYKDYPRSIGIGNVMESEYIRTIPIVSASGIEEFLRWSKDLCYK